jgi:hypothetical protein
MAVYDFQKGETIVGRVTQIDFEKGETIVVPKRTAQGQPFWGDKPAAWDTVSIAGKRLPGVAKLSGTAMEHRTDRQKSAGRHGAKIILSGYEPAPFDIILTLWTEEHLRTFEALIPVLKPKYPAQAKAPLGTAPTGEQGGFGGIKVRDETGNLITYEQFAQRSRAQKAKAQAKKGSSGPSPVDVIHPNLAMWGIRSAQVLSVGFLESRGESGDVKECRLKCLEYVGRRGASVLAANKSRSDFTAGIRTAYSFDAPPRRERPSDNVGPSTLTGTGG